MSGRPSETVIFRHLLLRRMPFHAWRSSCVVGLEGNTQSGTTLAPSAKVRLFMGPAILYVDDERANLDLFRRSFDEEFSVLTAASGPAAIELLEGGEEVGVLVSDQRMEPMTGIELLTLAAARFPNIRRVLLTAYSDRDLLLQA